MLFFLLFLFFIYIVIFFDFKSSEQIKNNFNELKISVVIAAKNEEKNICQIIKSLSNQNYGKNNFEVIIIDDNSDDDTFKIAQSEISERNNFSIYKAKNKIFEGKRGAIQFGIDRSVFPYILITDADCKPLDNWLKSFSNKFNEGYDFVFGKAPYYQTNTMANKISCFDNLWTHILTFSFAHSGFPYSAASRSFGFKKDSFFNISGFENQTKTLSGDDDLLLQKAIKNKMKIGIVTDSGAIVYSDSKQNITDYILQKSRHTSTSIYYSSKTKYLLGTWHFLNLLFLSLPFFYFYNSNFIYPFLIKIVTDIFIIISFSKDFSYKFSVFEIIYLQIIYEILLVINFVFSFTRRNKW